MIELEVRTGGQVLARRCCCGTVGWVGCTDPIQVCYHVLVVMAPRFGEWIWRLTLMRMVCRAIMHSNPVWPLSMVRRYGRSSSGCPTNGGLGRRYKQACTTLYSDLYVLLVAHRQAVVCTTLNNTMWRTQAASLPPLSTSFGLSDLPATMTKSSVSSYWLACKTTHCTRCSIWRTSSQRLCRTKQ
jgi:hypothetical protein